jgi:hypothetical protein
MGRLAAKILVQMSTARANAQTGSPVKLAVPRRPLYTTARGANGEADSLTVPVTQMRPVQT